MKISILMRCAAAAAILSILGSLPGRAEAKDPDANNAASSGADAAAKKPASKDPIASAFLLPKGVKLNAKQQAAYDQLKADKEPLLQQAIDDLQSSQGGSTAVAAKKVRDLRSEIRDAINEILASNAAGSSQDPNRGGSDSPAAAAYPVPYAVPYYGGYYYPYRPYGYYPYYYPKSGDGKGKYAANGTNGKPAGRTSPPPRPAASSSSSNGAKR
jgi:flagellar basal body-associated protein FliL